MLNYLSNKPGKLEIKIYGQKDKENQQFLHAKCYIFTGESGSIGILGSSNFTKCGLEDNAELNYLETNTQTIMAVPGYGQPSKGHSFWFSEIWEKGEPWNQQLQEEVLHSPIGKKIFANDMLQQKLKFPKIREPEKIEYKMNKEQARLFYDTISIIAPNISNEKIDSNDNLILDMHDETKILGYYRYRAIEYLADEKDKAFYEKHNLNVKGISERLAQMMEIHLVKRLESSFAAFKESLRNLLRYCENMITMLDNNTVFICPDLDINDLLSPFRQQIKGSIEECYKDIEKRM